MPHLSPAVAGKGSDARVGRTLLSADQIDFLVAYLFPKDLWYVFPVALVEHRKIMCLTPGSKNSKYEKYREAWKLMGPTNTEPASRPPPPDLRPP